MYAGKGENHSTTSFRGILVSDHCAKITPAFIQKTIEREYEHAVGSMQFGSVRRRGAALASLLLLSVVKASRLHGLAFAVVYLDLSKAFGHAIWEVVLGWLAHQRHWFHA